MRPTPQTRTWGSAWRSLLANLIGIVVVVVIVDVVVRVAIAYVTSDPASRGLRTFATSPGMAGVSAVAAASIAFAAVHRQLAHVKKVAREEAWWKAFEWATDRALPMDPNQVHMPRTWSIDLLTPMYSEAATAFQRRAAGGVSSRITDLLSAEMQLSAKTDATPPEPADSLHELFESDDLDERTASAAQTALVGWKRMANTAGNHPVAAEVQATLERYLHVSRHSPAQSESAEALLHRLRVEGHVEAIAANNKWEVVRVPGGIGVKSDQSTVFVALDPPTPEALHLVNTRPHAALIYAGRGPFGLKTWRLAGPIVKWVPGRFSDASELNDLTGEIVSAMDAARRQASEQVE